MKDYIKRKSGAGYIYVLTLLMILTACLAFGCSKNGEEGSENMNTQNSEPTATPTLTPTPTPVPVIIELEAEDQTFAGNVKAATAGARGFSGTGFVEGFQDDTDTCDFKVNVDIEGFYDLEFITMASDHKENFVDLDGSNIGSVPTDTKEFAGSKIERVYLTKGMHTVTFRKSWGWVKLDKLIITSSKPLPEDLYEVSAKLINENATDNTKRLMSYLVDIYGEKMLTGQYCDTGMFGMENAAVWRITGGEYPAVLGLDFMNYSPTNVRHGVDEHATDYAIECWEKGGIVTFVWHWTTDEKYHTGNWYSTFYKDSTNIDLAKIMNGQDEFGYNTLLEGIDSIAKQLLILQDAGVPVLWRPLHEASGGWFWWGAAGAEPYKELWKLLYEKLTYEYGCNNLIWLWNGQDADWYPGDEYVDIIGVDIYPGEKVYSSQASSFLEAAAYSDERKIVVLSENGCMFDPELAKRDGAMWGFFATWSGDFVLLSPGSNRWSEQYTEEYMVKKVYGSELMITRSELPDLKNYPIKDE